MTKYRNDYSAGHPSPMSIQQEVKLWEEHWLRGSRELNQWETLSEYANTKDGANPSIILESAWRLPNWNTMKASYQSGFEVVSLNSTEHDLKNSISYPNRSPSTWWSWVTRGSRAGASTCTAATSPSVTRTTPTSPWSSDTSSRETIQQHLELYLVLFVILTIS